MTCTYCGFRNGEGEHRCHRCGRKPGDTLSTEYPFEVDGALAAQPRPAVRRPDAAQAQGRPAVNLARAVQRPLFHDQGDSNVIPFESYAPPVERRPRKSGAATGGKAPVRRAPRVPEGQGSLDFLPPLPDQRRTLGTTVEAVIYCEAPVALPLHRAIAAAFDWSMVLIGYGFFLLAFTWSGGRFLLSKQNLMIFAAVLPLLGFTYGLFWALAKTETPGMRWARLRLTTFDGYPPELKERLLRFAGSCLSFCTVAGLLWSLADEESLTWHDHISRTFPTPRDLGAQIFQRR
jgi:uncharacterized RDD family membrane protein YckC